MGAPVGARQTAEGCGAGEGRGVAGEDCGGYPDGALFLAQHPAQVPDSGDQVVGRHAPERARSALHVRVEGREHRPDVLGDRRPQLRLPAGGGLARAERQVSRRGVQPQLIGTNPGHLAGQVPRPAEEQTAGPEVVVQQPRGGDVRTRDQPVRGLDPGGLGLHQFLDPARQFRDREPARPRGGGGRQVEAEAVAGGRQAAVGSVQGWRGRRPEHQDLQDQFRIASPYNYLTKHWARRDRNLT